MFGGIIENEAAGAVLGTMLGEKDYGMLEKPLPQSGVGNEKLSLEADWGFLSGEICHGPKVAGGSGRVKRGWVIG